MEAVQSAMGLGILLQVKDLASDEFGKIRNEMQETKNASKDLIQSFDSNMKKMSMGLGMAATGAGILAATFVGPMSMAMQAQYNMAEVNTLVGKNQEAMMARLGEQADETAIKFGKSTGEMTSAMYNLISSGVAADKVGGVLETVGKLAAGGMTDMATASDGLTSLMNAFGVAVENSESVADSMFIAMKRGKTTIGELSSSIGQVAPIAAKAGLSIDDMLGSIATATLSGLGTSESITGLRATLQAIMAPSEEAKKLTAELGIQYDEQALKAKGLRGVLDDLMTATGGNADKMVTLLGSVEAFGFVSNVMKENGGIWASIMDDMAKKSGAADEAFSIVADTWLHKWNVIKTTFTVGIKRFGAVFLPIMGIILTPIGLLVKGFAALPKPILALIGTIVAFGAIMLISRGLVIAHAAAMKLWSAGARNQFVTSAIRGQRVLIGLNMQFLRSTMFMAGQIAAIYLLYKAYQSNFLGIKTAVSWIAAAWDVAMSATEDGTAKIKKSVLKGLGFENLEEGAQVISRIASVFFRLKNFVIEFAGAFKNEFQYVMQTIDQFGESVLGIGDGAFTGLLKSLLNIDKSSLATWKEWGQTLGKLAFYILAIGVPIFIAVQAFGMLAAFVSGVISIFGFLSTAISVVGAVIAFLVSPIGLVIAAVVAVIAGIWLLVKNWDSICQFISTIWQVVCAFITQAWNGLVAAFVAIGESIRSAIASIFTAIIVWVVGALSGLIGIVSSIGQTISTLWSSFCAFVSSTFAGLGGFLLGMGQVILGIMMAPWVAIVSFIKGFCGTFFNSGASLWEAFCAGIKSAINGPVEVVKSGLAKIRRLLPFSDAKEGPLSTLTLSGSRLMTTIATGVDAGAPVLSNTIANTFSTLPIMNGESPSFGDGQARPTTMKLLTERFVSTHEKNTVEKSEREDRKNPVVENIIYLDGEQIYRSVKRHDRYDRLREGDDSAEG